MVRILSSVLVAAALATSATAQSWEGAETAFFGVAFLDTSNEGELNGPREDEAARVDLMEAYVAEALTAQGMVLLDLAPVADELARTANPAKCNGCALRMAEKLGARYAVVSEVQKTSNLILSVNIYVREVATGRQVAGQAVEIRGNTDDSWIRGARYILRNNIFKGAPPAP